MTAQIQVPARTCEHCGKPFGRRRFPSGQLERVQQFAKRRFCSDGCYRKAAADGGKVRPAGTWIVEPYAQKAQRATVGDPVLSARATSAKHTSQRGAPPPGGVFRALAADTTSRTSTRHAGETP